MHRVDDEIIVGALRTLAGDGASAAAAAADLRAALATVTEPVIRLRKHLAQAIVQPPALDLGRITRWLEQDHAHRRPHDHRPV